MQTRFNGVNVSFRWTSLARGTQKCARCKKPSAQIVMATPVEMQGHHGECQKRHERILFRHIRWNGREGGGLRHGRTK